MNDTSCASCVTRNVPFDAYDDSQLSRDLWKSAT